MPFPRHSGPVTFTVPTATGAFILVLYSKLTLVIVASSAREISTRRSNAQSILSIHRAPQEGGILVGVVGRGHTMVAVLRIGGTQDRVTTTIRPVTPMHPRNSSSDGWEGLGVRVVVLGVVLHASCGHCSRHVLADVVGVGVEAEGRHVGGTVVSHTVHRVQMFDWRQRQVGGHCRYSLGALAG